MTGSNEEDSKRRDSRIRLLQELLASGGYICYESEFKSKLENLDENNNSVKNLSSSGTLVSDASTATEPSARTARETPQSAKSTPRRRKTRTKSGRRYAHLLHLAFVLSLTNIITFPSLCGKYGGAIFLIPLTLSYVFVGIPLLYMEMALGQFSSISPVEIFRRISPALSGLAVSVIAIDFYQNLYNSGYITGAAFAGTKALERMWRPVPWQACNNSFNSRFCYDHELADRCGPPPPGHCQLRADESCARFCDTSHEIANSTFHQWIPPHMDFFAATTFQTKFRSSDLEWPGWQNIGILAALWTLVGWLSAVGLRKIGNGFVYLKIGSVIIVFVSVSFSLFTERPDGGGLRFMFQPHDFSYLLLPDIWSNAVACVVMSLNLGTGTIHKISAYSDFNQNFFLSAVIVCVCDLLFSLVVGVGLFTCMGSVTAFIYGPESSHLRIQMMYREGTTMLWTMFPEQVTHVMGDSLVGNALIALHYFNFLFLGLPGMTDVNSKIFPVVNVTLIRNALTDIALAVWPADRRNVRRRLFTVLISLSSFTLALIFIQPTGLNLSHLWYQAICGALMATCLIELIAIVHCYGFRRFIANIQSMLIGHATEHSIPLLTPCFRVITPIVLTYAIALKVGTYHNLIGGYLLPLELELYGRFITVTCLIPIPATVLCHLYKLRSRRLMRHAFYRPTVDWGPSTVENRHWKVLLERKNSAVKPPAALGPSAAVV